MSQCANCNCDQGRRECPGPAEEMPFADLADRLIGAACEACGWILAAVVVVGIVSTAMRWAA